MSVPALSGGHEDAHIRPPPRLADLPPPPEGKEGWPWTEESPALPEAPSIDRTWPRISIVTPSFNQAEYIERTIRSVLLQGYPGLEYMVIDGGSNDGSIEIIRRYEPWLTHWESGPDRGQSHAINKGFGRATGDILAWLNSDDMYLPSALRGVGKLMAGGSCDLSLGSMRKVEEDQSSVRFLKLSTPYGGMPIHYYPILNDGSREWFSFYQPAMFWTRKLWNEVGDLDESYHYVMDLHWCHRALAKGARVGTQEQPLVQFTIHVGSKTNDVSYRFSFEQIRMFRELARRPEFRWGQCHLSTTRHVQSGFSLLSTRLAEEGKIVRAWLSRMIARVMKQFRRLLPQQAESAPPGRGTGA